MLKHVIIYPNVLLVATEKIQLINFEVKAFLFPESLYDRNDGLNDTGLLVNLNVGDNLHDVSAQRCELLSIDIFCLFAFMLYFFYEFDGEVFHKVRDFFFEVEEQAIGLSKSVETGFFKIKHSEIHGDNVLFERRDEFTLEWGDKFEVQASKEFNNGREVYLMF